MRYFKRTLLLLLAGIPGYLTSAQPNVILIMTDDQGYGDVPGHGNPVLKTPELDKLREQSVRFTDFHVAPMCTPTRGQLMSGMDAMRNGATEVNGSRSMLRNDLKIIPQYFAEAGYATGMFGKWHLGDSYPFAPRFRGFDEVLRHRDWGITSLADYWGNTYFDPVLEHNGMDKKYNGYCTDIYFSEAMKWMLRCHRKGQPFFAYIPTNTPHVPEQVAGKYSDTYQGTYDGKEIPHNFFGMIANIDENIGKLEVFLHDQGLRDNTILLFLTDNGTQSAKAMQIFNAGMRSKKTSLYEGGHRVPLFVRWIDGRLVHGSDISELAQVQDILPTLADLCGLDLSGASLDGNSLSGLLKGEQMELEDRMCVIQYLWREADGEKWQNAAVMKDKWRMIGGEELYNIADDPGQEKNVIDSYPEVARKMSAHYDEWYEGIRPIFDQRESIIVGSDRENPVKIYSSDWVDVYCGNSRALKEANAISYWELEVARTGEYEIELRRWAEESGKALTDSYDATSGEGAIPVAKARLQVGDFDQTVDTRPEDTFVRFSANLPKGKTELTASFLDTQGKVICGATYLKITRKQANYNYGDDPHVVACTRNRELVADNPDRPLYHFSAPDRGIHDPNGLCYWQGHYHLFYQYYYKGISWGHAYSDDLLHWKDLPVAIEPTVEERVFSGQTLAEDNRVIAMWHGLGIGNMVATSTDPLLLDWDPNPNNPVIPSDEKQGDYRVFDPCIWKGDDGYYYSLTGSYKDGIQRKDCIGEVHAFKSRDLSTWKWLGPMFTDTVLAEPGEDMAVPNFWPIGKGKHLLLLFSHKRAGRGYVGTFDSKTIRFDADYHFRANHGTIVDETVRLKPVNSSVHAPSATIDDKGRYIAVFNMCENKEQEGWSGIMSLPRVYSLAEDNSIRVDPVEEMKKLRFDHKRVNSVTIKVNKDLKLKEIAGRAMEISAVIRPGKAKEVGFKVLQSADDSEYTVIRFSENKIAIDNKHSSKDTRFIRPPDAGSLQLEGNEPLKLRIFIDCSVVEVFANGRQCCSLRVYPTKEGGNGVSLFSRGGDAELVSLDAWQMRSVWPELKFKEGS